jgi:hypothetical protein
VVHRPHQLHQLVIDDLDDLMAGIDAANDLLTDGLLGDTLNEGLGNVVIDVGLQKRTAYLFQTFADIGFCQPTATG